MDKDLEQKLQSRLDINDILSGFWQSSKDSKSPEEYQAHLNKASKRFSTLLSQELKERDEVLDLCRKSLENIQKWLMFKAALKDDGTWHPNFIKSNNSAVKALARLKELKNA